jgi:hypothetical protein
MELKDFVRIVLTLVELSRHLEKMKGAVECILDRRRLDLRRTCIDELARNCKDILFDPLINNIKLVKGRLLNLNYTGLIRGAKYNDCMKIVIIGSF